ncbi:TolC family protein [Chitinophagaceae bacterium MMS25-I14]
MRRLFKFILTLTMLAPVWAKAQEVKELSLEDCIDYAIKHNAATKNARLDIAMQKAKNAEVTGIAYPQISAQGKYTDYIDPVQTFIPAEFFGGTPGTFAPIVFTPKHNVGLNAFGSQVLFDGSVMVALQARNTLMLLARQSAQQSEEDIRYNIQKAYYSMVISQRQFSIIKSTMAVGRDAAHDTHVMRENGIAEQIDIDRADVQLNNLISDSLIIANALTVNEQMLKYTMGMDINTPIVLTDTSLTTARSEAAELLTDETSYDQHTNFQLLETQLKLNEYDLKRYKYQGLPRLSAFANAGYTYSSNRFSDIFKEQYIWSSLAGLQLDIPIFDGMQRHKRVTQAKLTVEKTKNNLENLKLGINFLTATARTNLRDAILNLQITERTMNLAASVLDLARKKYKAGVGSNQEVNLAQSDFLQAQNNYFNAMQNVVNTHAELKKALGLFKQ